MKENIATITVTQNTKFTGDVTGAKPHTKKKIEQLIQWLCIWIITSCVISKPCRVYSSVPWIQ